ncbi:uncharacterized protein I303_102146 [Kwoniella dejecticola CBS 10117]|uniref:Nudix hydrolase domain-containing protein n=1 Tax=Kwoniella dejecticola CBS 10117 TaxID=1296121 RepID=A0A1A6ABR5_9TREE|nr:uncharacterized protein I303_01713 [Kwoniella dejecticola CBS 10117]OBR87506.1 hypothetical protein I303_01713 [Kwoniella dejecticola CBS 10117]
MTRRRTTSTKMPPTIEYLLPPLKPESLQCIYRLQRYVPPLESRRYPKRRSAAVAVILFVGRLGDLYVLLSTRAGDMRTYAHDTALPGGKYEEGDIDAEGTARREAYEEIGLPMDRNKVMKLCELEKFITGNSLIVTPVIFIITDHTLTPLLNPEEVKRLFSMPLSAFLHSRPSQIPSFHYNISHRLSSIPSWVIDSIPPPPVVNYALDDGHVGGKEGRFYGYRDIIWATGPSTGTASSSASSSEPISRTSMRESSTSRVERTTSAGKGHAKESEGAEAAVERGLGQGKVRMHRFLTGRESQGIKPVYGLTAAILIRAASVGFDQQPDFPINAPGQKTMIQRITHEIRHGEGPLRRAVEAEGLWDDWKGADSDEEDHDHDNKGCAKAKL